MSQRLVARSADLKRLRDEGFDIKIVETHLLVRGVPYVTASKEVKTGTIVTPLDLQQDVTTKPGNHVVFFIGDHPCSMSGEPLTKIVIGSENQTLVQGVTVNFTLSSKPTHGRGYADYHEKITTYVKMLANEAESIDPNVTAATFPLVLDEDSTSPFKYLDTASSRAGIDALSPKLALDDLAIVGLGGTGSYILDLVAKTRVQRIHLYDDDIFGQHNAFRAPGAAGVDAFGPPTNKANYYERMYSAMRHGLVAHPYRLDETNADELGQMKFVFLCIDRGDAKEPIIRVLEDAGIPFIDVGMGVHQRDGSLFGSLRATTSTPSKRDHTSSRISFAPRTAEDEYASSIQVADLNALNATLAVIKWKKLYGFYHDLQMEHHAAFVIETSKLSREDL